MTATDVTYLHDIVVAETATVRLDPAAAVEDPSWLTLTAWQGGGLVVDRLEQTGPGTYRSTRPLPVTGDGKTLLRLRDGRALYASAVWMPADSVLGAPEISASPTSTRTLGPEIALLQRERKLDALGGLWAVSSLVVLGCSPALVVSLARGVGRLSHSAQGTGELREPRTPARGPARRPVRASLA